MKDRVQICQVLMEKHECGFLASARITAQGLICHVMLMLIKCKGQGFLLVKPRLPYTL